MQYTKTIGVITGPNQFEDFCNEKIKDAKGFTQFHGRLIVDGVRYIWILSEYNLHGIVYDDFILHGTASNNPDRLNHIRKYCNSKLAELGKKVNW